MTFFVAPRQRFRPETLAFCTYAATSVSDAPDAAYKGKVDTLVRALMAGGAWAVLGGLWLQAGWTAASGLVNLINPSGAKAVNSGATWTKLGGYKGDGVSAFMDSGLPLTSIPNFSQASAHLGGFSTFAGQSSGSFVGQPGGSSVRLIPRGTTDLASGRVLDGNTDIFTANVDGTGHYVVQRTSALAGSMTLYKNGAVIDTAGGLAAGSIAGANLRMFNYSTVFWAGSAGVIHIGGSASDAVWAAASAAFAAYMASI